MDTRRFLATWLVAGLAVARVASAETSHERDATVDRALGHLDAGGRLLGPGAALTKEEAAHVMAGDRLHPTLDTGAGHAAGATGGTSGRPSAGAGAPSVGGAVSGVVGGGPSVGGGASVTEPSVGAGGGGIGGGTDLGGGGNLGGGGGTGSVSEPPVTDTGGAGNEPWLDVSGDVGVGDTTVDAGVTVQENPLQDVTVDLGTATIIDEIIDTTLESTHENIAISGGAELSGGTETATGVDVSGSTIGGEADAGLEAEVDGAGDAGDVGSDPADGLLP